MRERLLKFMEMEKLSASRLAEILGVQPATISHIISGRNKPSFEFIEKMLLRFPKVNPEWFLLGKGSAYRPDVSSSPNPNPSQEFRLSANLFETANIPATESSVGQPERKIPGTPGATSPEVPTNHPSIDTKKTDIENRVLGARHRAHRNLPEERHLHLLQAPVKNRK